MAVGNPEPPQPLVSVVIPTYNRAEYLKQALSSVFRQTFTDYEVIVVDDGSTDGSRRIIEAFPSVKAIYQPNHGVAAARNAGVDGSSGLFLAFIDQDDLWLPEKTRVQLEYLLDHPDVGAVSCHTEFFLDGLDRKPDWLRQERFVLQAMRNFAGLFQTAEAELRNQGEYWRANRGQFSYGLEHIDFVEEVGQPHTRRQVLEKTGEIFNSVYLRTLEVLGKSEEGSPAEPLPLTSFMVDRPLA